MTKQPQYKLTDEWDLYMTVDCFSAFSVTIFSIAVFSSLTTWLPLILKNFQQLYHLEMSGPRVAGMDESQLQIQHEEKYR